MTSIQHLPSSSQHPVSSIPRIVIQEVRGAFHEIAARQFYGAEVEVVPAHTFAELFEKAADPDCADAAVLAIENSIAGSILGNYHLLQNSTLNIAGEVFLRIGQNLMALPGVALEELREVHSHPMALAQCAAFFSRHPHLRLVESSDTAASAAQIAREGLRHCAAVGSRLAGELYGLEVLAAGIETNPVNFTRFLAVQARARARPVSGADKVSISFSVPHQPGRLHEVLGLLCAQQANLTKIQSVPRIGQAWEYLFFVDFTMNDPDRIPETLELLDGLTLECRVLGIYKSAEMP